MAMRHRLICPYRETVTPMIDTQHPRHIEPASSNKRFMHIDGDILNRLLEHGAEELLRDMVEVWTRVSQYNVLHESGNTDFSLIARAT